MRFFHRQQRLTRSIYVFAFYSSCALFLLDATAKMPHPPAVSGIQVENVTFPPAARPPNSNSTVFLGGAGVRGLEIEGKLVKFTAIGVYLEDSAVPWLAGKWKGKRSVEELLESDQFSRDVVTGPFEKFTRVTMILPLTGEQYAQKLTENCINIWKSMGIYTESEAKAIEKFIQIFKPQTFPPGSSILYTQSPKGSLTISFSKDESIPEVGNAVIENKLLSEAVLESIIGKSGVSPQARKTLAERLWDLVKLEICGNVGGDDHNAVAAPNQKLEANKKVPGDEKVFEDLKVEANKKVPGDEKVFEDLKVEATKKVPEDEKVLEEKVDNEVERTEKQEIATEN